MTSYEIFILRYIATKGFFFALLTLAGFFMVMGTCKSYLLWKKNLKKNAFVGAIMQGVIALLLLTSAYPIFVCGVIKTSQRPIFTSGIYGSLLYVSPMLLSSFFVSKAYDYFQKLKIKRSTANLTCIWVCGLISFYCISMYFIDYLRHVIFLVS